MSSLNVPAITRDTTLNMTGAITSTGGSFPTDGFELRVNSSGTAAFSFNGGRAEDMRLYAPAADLNFSGQAVFAGSFIGKNVNLSGKAALNSTVPAHLNSPDTDTLSAETTAICNSNGICTATAEIKPTGNTCDNTGSAVDFTADSFLGHVEACDGFESCENLWQFCTLNGSAYDCVTVPDPADNCNIIY
jgi:hypothetical protein